MALCYRLPDSSGSQGVLQQATILDWYLGSESPTSYGLVSGQHVVFAGVPCMGFRGGLRMSASPLYKDPPTLLVLAEATHTQILHAEVYPWAQSDLELVALLSMSCEADTSPAFMTCEQPGLCV